MFYWAYGSNLNVEAMKARCPFAKKVGPLYVDQGILIFRGVADVEHCPGSIVAGGLWKITKECEERLDRYEGVGSKLYSKKYMTLLVKGKQKKCLYYKMNSDGIMPPWDAYLDCIVQGYRDFGLDLDLLEEALARSWQDKNKTPDLRWRYQRKGKPRLARELSA